MCYQMKPSTLSIHPAKVSTESVDNCLDSLSDAAVAPQADAELIPFQLPGNRPHVQFRSEKTVHEYYGFLSAERIEGVIGVNGSNLYSDLHWPVNLQDVVGAYRTLSAVLTGKDQTV